MPNTSDEDEGNLQPETLDCVSPRLSLSEFDLNQILAIDGRAKTENFQTTHPTIQPNTTTT